MSCIRMQAHRGVSTECPENTLSAFRAAIVQGYDVLELDPAVTKDGVVVVLHDKTVNRTGRLPDGRKIADEAPIGSLTYAEVSRLDFGRWFSDQFIGEPIPTLREVLALAAENRVTVKHLSEETGSRYGFRCAAS